MDWKKLEVSSVGQFLSAYEDEVITIIMDKMWEVQETDSLSVDERSKMAEDLGKELKDLILKYTEINTFELYE
jgi:hypothetical protein